MSLEQGVLGSGLYVSQIHYTEPVCNHKTISTPRKKKRYLPGSPRRTPKKHGFKRGITLGSLSSMSDSQVPLLQLTSSSVGRPPASVKRKSVPLATKNIS